VSAAEPLERLSVTRLQRLLYGPRAGESDGEHLRLLNGSKVRNCGRTERGIEARVGSRALVRGCVVPERPRRCDERQDEKHERGDEAKSEPQ
jgi:hypothetical protein